MSDGPNAALLESWALSLHGKSPGTRALYLRIANWFQGWLRDNDRPASTPGDLLAVSRQDAEAWFGAQRAAGLAPATLRSRWIALRNLYGWLTEEDEISDNPMAKVRVEKANPEPIRVLPDDELRALLKACEGKAFLDRRDLALIRLLASTGMRLSEVAGLRLGDVDLVKRVAYVEHGKGDKARWVRFDADTAAALDRYKRARARHRYADLPWLWLGRGGRFTSNGVPLMLVRRARQAGIGHVHPHQLRHTFAHRYLESGGNEGDLQRLGGWESAEVMRRYGSARAVDRALAAYDDVNVMGKL
ncbi:MAG: tyrosine-type recombinase/integrase [Actinomycetota bacterium]